MKIGIDCRMYGLKHAGIGRYVKNLIEGVLLIGQNNKYVLFANHELVEEITKGKWQTANVKIVETSIKHYSLKEQLLFPGIIKGEKVDVMHFPHFNVPIFYYGKYIVTIHDLIKHSSRGMATTTKSPLTYIFKYFGYKLVFYFAVKKAFKIIVPSEFVKSDLIRGYRISERKVFVTYEGVDEEIKNFSHTSLNQQAAEDDENSALLKNYKIVKPFILYVGSVYPHKNIVRLIEAVKSLQKSDFRLQLVVVCARNVFWERLKETIFSMKAEEFVSLTGFVPDGDLSVIYREAEAFIFPSLSEGFGLPGLEAMGQKTPVIASNIPVFKEVYGQAAAYFNPLDPQKMADKIYEVINNPEERNKLITKGEEQVKKYSWRKMAQETLQIYNLLNV